MSPVTPDKIRTLQRKLYCKAKAEPAFRFYVLYDKICRADILRHAYGLARANAGAPGVDGVSFAQIEERGVEEWLAGLREELVSKTYRPDPVRRVMIPKPGGGERALGIPTIRDRVIQTAVKLVLEPIFEADFEDNAYGYRPARGAADAVKDVYRHLRRRYTDVVDADLSRYFDSIPHDDLLKSVARRVADGSVAAAQAVAQSANRGTGWRREAADGWREEEQARHASRWCCEPTACQHLHEPVPEALASKWMWRSLPCPCRLLCRRLRHPQPRSSGRGADVDEGGDDQARVDAQRGQDLAQRCPSGALHIPWLLVRTAPSLQPSARMYLHMSASPSKKSVQRLKTKVRELLVPGNNDPWPEVRDDLNRSLRGWSSYFNVGSPVAAFRSADHYVRERVRGFLARRHKVAGRGNRRFTHDDIYGTSVCCA